MAEGRGIIANEGNGYLSWIWDKSSQLQGWVVGCRPSKSSSKLLGFK